MSSLKTLFLITFSSVFVLSACGKEPVSQPETKEKPSSTNTSSAEIEKKSNTPESKPKVDRGASLYKRCRTCHTLDKDGRHKAGPNLYGMYGAKAGAKEGFRYSKAMKESGLEWNDENLAAYIQRPAKFLPGGAMQFAGFRNEEDVKILLEYLKKKTSE